MIKVNSIKTVIEFVDDTTGEIFVEERVLGEETKKLKKSNTFTKKLKDDGSNEPHLTVLDNKLQLNNAAVELTHFIPDSKISIKFEKKGKETNPVILEDTKEGNRLTKTYTISCRGSKRDELLKFGDVFILEAHPTVDGAFLLKGNAPEKEDDIIDIPEEIASDDDLDTSVDSIDNFDFNFD